MDVVIILNDEKKNKNARKDSNYLLNNIKHLITDSTNKIYLIYDEKDRKLIEEFNDKYDKNINLVKVSESLKDGGILSKINDFINKNGLKDDLLIILNLSTLNAEFPNIIEYLEATRKPTIILKKESKKKIRTTNGVILDKNNFVKNVIERPINPKTNLTCVGVYFIPKDAIFWIKKIANTGADKTSFNLFIKKLAQKRNVRGLISEKLSSVHE